MEVAVRVLNLLLILVLVFQGLCAVPGIGKRQFFPWEIIPDIVPDIILYLTFPRTLYLTFLATPYLLATGEPSS